MRWSLWRAWWAIRDCWRGYDASDIASLRYRVALAQFGDPDETMWLSPEETLALGARQASGIGVVNVRKVDRGRALISVKQAEPLAPLRRR